MGPVAKMKVVPPSISIGSRSWWVITNVGRAIRRVGTPPADPAVVGPRAARETPNMLRPRMVAPTFSKAWATKWSSTPCEPPSWPIISRPLRVANIQSVNPSVWSPNGCLRRWLRPAANPSTDIMRQRTTSFGLVVDMGWLLDRLVLAAVRLMVRGESRSVGGFSVLAADALTVTRWIAARTGRVRDRSESRRVVGASRRGPPPRGRRRRSGAGRRRGCPSPTGSACRRGRGRGGTGTGAGPRRSSSRSRGRCRSRSG